MIMEWRDILGWEGYYQVCEDGQVRSVTRTVASARYPCGTRRFPGQMMKPFFVNGRAIYDLVRSRRRTRIPGHHLVALAFIGPWPAGAECVRHLDDVPSHNHYSNLAYGTIAQNVADSIANGTFPRGEKSGAAKLTTTEVLTIRREIEAGQRGIQTELAARYGVSNATISQIKHGSSWAGVA
mgnify:CR=1 FL=1